MTKSAFSGHCERFEESRGNLKTSLLDFGNRPFRGNDKCCFDKIPEVQASLPDGVSLVPYYEQAELIKQATRTVKKALLQGAVLVIIVLFCFLGNFRSAFIVSLALPLCALISIIFMRLMGISANLMSLGGIVVSPLVSACSAMVLS